MQALEVCTVSRIAISVPPDLTEDRVLTILQVASAAGVSPDTIRRAAKRDELKITRLSARRVGIRASEYRRWLTAGTG